MPKKKKQYTYDEICAHLAIFEGQASWTKVLTLEIFSDDNCVTLINVKDKKIAQFQNMEEFMNCKSYEDAITKYTYKRF